MTSAQATGQSVQDTNTKCSPGQYVDWLQVQGFLAMAESALRAKNAANDILRQGNSAAMPSAVLQTAQQLQAVRQDQAEDTSFLRQQLEALLQERAAAKEKIAGLQRENAFLLEEREILFRQLEIEAGHAESDRRVRSLLSARRSEEDLSAVRTYAHQPREQHDIGIEPVTPQDPAEAARLIPQQMTSITQGKVLSQRDLQPELIDGYATPERRSELQRTL